MKILGISAYYHDSAAALLVDGKIVAAAQEERFTRIKQDSAFPENAIRFCLDYAGLRLADVDQVVFYDKPLLKFERLIETYYSFVPHGLRSFAAAMPVWVKEKLLLRSTLKKELKALDPDAIKLPKLIFSEHHLSHAASAFYPSPFNDAAILTVDGVGEWATTTIGYGKGTHIELLKEMTFPHSWGLLYSAFTYYVGFRVNSGEYKLMGLAPYGDPTSEETQRYEKLIRDQMIDLRADGSLWLNMEFFNFATGLTMTNDSKWEQLLGLKRREPEAPTTQSYCNLALAIQHITEDGMLRLANEAKRLTGSENLVLAGGVALNCVANGKILRAEIFKNIWIQPAAGDAGGALGAALAAWHLYNEKPRLVTGSQDAMSGSFLGPEYSDEDVEKTARKYGAQVHRYESFHELSREVARLIADGNVVGWHQGRMEWGPRALGNRSILGDARNPEMQKRLNLKIKYRESFRPFAPVVLAEEMNQYFELDVPSPYMLLVADVKKERQKPLPKNFQSMSLKDKLYYLRSDMPAITHLDYSARVQSVHRSTNPRFWQLLHDFKEITGYPVLVNTSFNVRGEPIVCTPDDSFRCFMRTEMDFLVVGNCLFRKSEQAGVRKELLGGETFALD